MSERVTGEQSSDPCMRCRRLDMRESSAEAASARRSTRSSAWIAVFEARHAAIRSPSHSSMKAENWFQLRIVGVTTIRARLQPGIFFGRLIGRQRALTPTI